MTTILFLAADPTNATRLRLGEELREIQEKLQLAKSREDFALHQRLSIRPADLSQALLDLDPDIVHFSGHGTVDGALCVEDRLGNMQPIPAEALASLFEQFIGRVKCVILNACYSETQAQAIVKHIEYVIGMNQAIGDRAAIAFSIGFYQAIGASRSIEDAYKLGCVQIRIENIPEHWTPILLKKTKLPSYEAVITSHTAIEPQPSQQQKAPNLKVVKLVSNTGLSSVFMAQQPDGTKVLLRQRPEGSVSGLDYFKVRLDRERFAIPETIWHDQQFIYEAVPYREGWSLAEIIELNKGNICGQLIKSWAFELLSLLDLLHRHTPPIIHRDLKPENILVTPDGLHLVLLDLASAVFFSPYTRYDVIGTDGYTPPEQIEGVPVPASDLYALAATLFKMNSGLHPPSCFDRQRGNAKFYLKDVDPYVAFIYASIANLDITRRSKDAQSVIRHWNSFTPNTFRLVFLNPIKLPNGQEIEQLLSDDGHPTSIVI